MTRTLRSKICHRRGNWPINLWGNRHVYLLEQTSDIYTHISVKIVVRVREIFVRFNKKKKILFASSLISSFLIFHLSEFIVSFLNSVFTECIFFERCMQEGRGLKRNSTTFLQLIFYCRGTVYVARVIKQPRSTLDKISQPFICLSVNFISDLRWVVYFFFLSFSSIVWYFFFFFFFSRYLEIFNIPLSLSGGFIQFSLTFQNARSFQPGKWGGKRLKFLIFFLRILSIFFKLCLCTFRTKYIISFNSRQLCRINLPHPTRSLVEFTLV